ncbi:UvrD-helicase domain-containing protein [candidate division KSB1 bacterium]|nr:UvrD-helicase domain-containing protein [candidate division KSB1 bacterium]
MSGRSAAKSAVSELLTGLNPIQQEAVQWTGGPVLILAGAGSGKTRVLTHRIAYLIEAEKIKPWNILAMTFTNKAAGEMRERIRKLCRDDSQNVWMGTFHSIFARILRYEGEKLGYGRNFSIYDSDDQINLVKEIMNEYAIPQKDFAPRAISSHISKAKNALVEPDHYARSAQNVFEDKVAIIYPQYQERLKQLNAMDFDDLLIKPIALFRDHPPLLEHYQLRFPFLLVDEYQDTNRAQYSLIKMLASRSRNVCVVGDDDQSIYRWRGADIRNILDFEKDFPDCRVFRLEQNYRSTKNILSAAHSVVSKNAGRMEKQLWTEKETGEKVLLLATRDAYHESRKIVDKIKDELHKSGRNFTDFAILYRINAQSRILEEGLLNEGISYIIVGGLKFYERKEVKDVLAYLRAIVNPHDTISIKRIINYPLRGIGKVSIEKVERFGRSTASTFFDAMGKAHSIDELSIKAKTNITNFHKFIIKYQSLVNKISITELARALVDEIGILQLFRQEGTAEATSRYENVLELLQAITEYSKRTESPTLAGFLEEVSLLTDIDSWDNRSNAVTLMTLHSAKGLEFPVVFIAGLEEGLFPLSRSFESVDDLEEERRLFYVGATRAEEKLFLSWAAQRGRFGDTFMNTPSRFILEIDAQYIEEDIKSRSARRSASADRKKPKSSVYVDYEEPRYIDDSNRDVEFLEPGATVKHPTFGKGIILNLEGDGESMKATVAFDLVGRKKLMVKYANLEII